MLKIMKTSQIAVVLLGLLLIPAWVSAQPTSNPPSQNREQNVRQRLAERAAAATITNAHSFGIFMPREDVLGSTPDVVERIRTYLKSKPEDIPLAKNPLISDKDIVSYDWESHTLTVDPSVLPRIKTTHVWGTPFVVVVDGKPIYVGAFYSGASSQSCPLPVIMTDPWSRTNNTIKIQRGYPTGNFAPTDFRPDPRIKTVLQELGKLK